MKQIIIILFSALSILARGGDTLKYSNDVDNLNDGDVFYAEKHWKSLKDSIQKTVNGRLGNKNIASDAAISLNKLDSTGILRADTVKAKTLSIDTNRVSFEVLTTKAEPATPPAGKVIMWLDTSWGGWVRIKFPNGKIRNFVTSDEE